jgi:hypothetical protein
MAPRIRRSRSTASFALVACALGMAGSGCDRASGAQPTASASQAAASARSGACAAGASSSACSAPTPAVVTRVVFIGKKEACDCTRKAIDAGLKSLETTLAAGHAMPVEKLDVDADPDQVNTYRLMKPFVALPAIYFLDVNEGLVELLQGEVSEAQVQTVLR